jgi:hypothetical protein
LHLTLTAGTVAVCRLEPEAAVPDWVWADAPLRSATRTSDELSIVCAADAVPEEVRHEGPYAVLGVTGPLDFSLVGILAALATVLAAAGISIFVIATFDTDYVLVAERDVGSAVSALEVAGHLVSRAR